MESLYFDLLVALSEHRSEYSIRVARQDDGTLYASRTERRNDYADETVFWADDAQQVVRRLRENNIACW